MPIFVAFFCGEASGWGLFGAGGATTLFAIHGAESLARGSQMWDGAR